MKSFAVALAVVCLQSSLSAQRWFVSQIRPNERVVGLLHLPDVTGNYADDACPTLRSVQLYDQPSTTGTAIGTVYLRQHPQFGCELLFRRAGTSIDEELPTE